MRTCMFLCAGFLLAAGLPAQGADSALREQYSLIRLFPASEADMRVYQELGVCLDHYTGKVGASIRIVAGREEIRRLREAGVAVEVLVEDMEEDYARRTPAPSSRLRPPGEGFGYGSMGGFFTYAEVNQRLDTLAMLYPTLISPRIPIGTTSENRILYGVEISDNPGEPEPGEASVYFDALHHAREPMSMAVAMYFAYWLLENYATNPEAAYLVNNRRIFIVPVVNADGYVYNQTTNPNGGGQWRKSRSFNVGGSRGVDLNRNYGYKWGYDNTGSSPTPSSETYRGPSAWSEPETRAVRDFVLSAAPAIGFSLHSVAGHYLNPYGYVDSVVAFEYYAEFAGDFSRQNGYLYGTVSQMLSYASNGTTRDWLHHDAGCFAWTPEIGGSDFWPQQSEIIPLCQENLYACKYLAWVAGARADYQSFRMVGAPSALPGDTLRCAVTIRNKGLRLAARQVEVSLQPLHGGVLPVVHTASFSSLAPRQAASNDSLPFVFLLPAGLTPGDAVSFVCTVRQEGVETTRDTLFVPVGHARVLFAEDAEGGPVRWTRSGSGTQWDSSFVLSCRGTRSLADSRYGNVGNSSTTYLTTTAAVDLAGSQRPRLEFSARWANEAGYDYVRIQASTNNGGTWTSLSGRLTGSVGGQPGYTGNRGAWGWEQISLQAYAGRQVKIRFMLVTDSGLRGDGFYFDDLRVADYRDTVVTAVAGSAHLPGGWELFQNHPNPCNPTTTITFAVPEPTPVSLRVYDLLGREATSLVEDVLPPGMHSRILDAGALGLASGVYWYRLRTPGFVGTRKLLILR
ncbi:MAG: M14 family zinc carboxypeptidase [Bacteroidota bacterium]